MPRLRRPLTLLLRLFLGGLLLYAAASKWLAPVAFAEELANYRLLPPLLVPLGAVAVLGAETLLGTALLWGLWLREAALLTTLLLGLFTTAVGSALLRGLQIECGCFGAGDSPATTWTLLRDLVFVAMAAALCALTGPRGDVPGRTAAGPPAG